MLTLIDDKVNGETEKLKLYKQSLGMRKRRCIVPPVEGYIGCANERNQRPLLQLATRNGDAKWHRLSKEEIEKS